MVKEPVVEPAGIEILEGTDAREVLLLDSVIMAPPVGAGPVNVTVPVDVPPPVTDAGFNDSEANVTGLMVNLAVRLMLL